METEQRMQYIEECGSACPYCRKTTAMRFREECAAIVRDRVQIQNYYEDSQPIIEIEAMCRCCYKSWTEIYRLVDVKEYL